MSWIFFYIETAVDKNYHIDESTSLWEIYSKIKPSLPNHRDLEPLLEMDRDAKKLESILAIKYKVLTVREHMVFLPFSINLDPYIKKVIRDEYLSQAALEGSDVGLGWFKDQEVNRSRSNLQLAAQSSSSKKLNSSTSRISSSHSDPPSKTVIPVPDSSKNVNTKMPCVPTRTVSPPVILPKDALSKKLSKKSLEEVCDLIRQIDGLMPSKIEEYVETIMTQNINGAVLSHCNLKELKAVLHMSFGDWEIFQLVILTLRKNEKMLNKLRTLELVPQPAVSRKDSAATQNELTEKICMMIPPTSVSDIAANMEDAMIGALLSTGK